MRFLPCLYAFLGCMSFCFIFQVRKPLFILLCSAIGAVSWGVYLLAEPLGSDAARCFVATIVVSSLAELLARRQLAPRIICESAGTQAEDAAAMKQEYLQFLK